MKLLYILLLLSICTYPIPTIRIGGQPLAIFFVIYEILFFSIKGYARKVDTRTLWPIGALLLGFFISSFVSESINTEFLINLIAFYLIFFVTTNIADIQEKQRFLFSRQNNIVMNGGMVGVLIISGIILGCYGWYGYITGKVGTEAQSFWWSAAKYWGIHYTPASRNADVHYIAFPFIAVLVRKNKKFIDVLLLLFFGAALLLSMARNTWLCIFVVLMVYLFLQEDINKKLKYILVVLMAAMIGYLTLGYFGMTDYFLGKLFSIISMESSSAISNSNSERFNLILTTLGIIIRHPIGVGAEELGRYYRDAGFVLNHAENTYLNIMAEMGLVALIAYASIVWTPIISMIRRKKSTKLDTRESFVLLAALYFALTILFNTETINCYMWIVVGIIWHEEKRVLRTEGQ